VQHLNIADLAAQLAGTGVNAPLAVIAAVANF